MVGRTVLTVLMPFVTSVFAAAVVTASLMNSTDGQVPPIDSNGVLRAHKPMNQPCVWTALDLLNQALAEAAACGFAVRGDIIVASDDPLFDSGPP